MSDRDRDVDWEDIRKGYIPHEGGVRGGYQPETSETDTPPRGGGGGSDSSEDDE